VQTFCGVAFNAKAPSRQGAKAQKDGKEAVTQPHRGTNGFLRIPSLPFFLSFAPLRLCAFALDNNQMIPFSGTADPPETAAPSSTPPGAIVKGLNRHEGRGLFAGPF